MNIKEKHNRLPPLYWLPKLHKQPYKARFIANSSLCTTTWGLTICLWLGSPWVNYWFSFTLAYSRINHEYSSLFIIVINLIFVALIGLFSYLFHALLLLKNIGIDTMIQFTKGTELTIFDQLKILMMFSINLNLQTFRLLNCLHMIFLHCILRYLIIL